MNCLRNCVPHNLMCYACQRNILTEQSGKWELFCSLPDVALEAFWNQRVAAAALSVQYKQEECIWKWRRRVKQEGTLPRDLALPLTSFAFMAKTVPTALWATGLTMKGELYEIFRCLQGSGRWGKWVKEAASVPGSSGVSHWVMNSTAQRHPY